MKFLVLTAVFALCFIIPGCSDNQPAQKIDFSKKEASEVIEAKNDVLTYAYLPQYSHSVSLMRHKLLVEYLKKETGYNVKQIFPDSFDEHMRLASKGKIDISFTNPYVYIKTSHLSGETAFAQVIEVSGNNSFRGQIITRNDNNAIRTIEDCKNKRLIAVDPTSAGGYLYPMGHFYEHGIRQQDFAEIHFPHGPGGKQEKVILAVYSGQYDIGLIREGALNVVADRIDVSQIRIVAHSKYYPGWLYSARKDLNPEILGRVKDALFKLSMDNPEHRMILEKADFIRVVASDDSQFNSVRDLVAAMGIDLDK